MLRVSPGGLCKIVSLNHRRSSLPVQAAPTFHTALGRAVHAFFFDPAQRGPGLPVAELFLPRWVGHDWLGRTGAAQLVLLLSSSQLHAAERMHLFAPLV